RPVIDDNAKIGVERQEAGEGLQMVGPQQGIEAKPAALKRGHRWLQDGPQHPLRIGDVLKLTVQALEAWIAGETLDLRRRIGGFEIDPAEDAEYAGALGCQRQDVVGLGHRGGSLDQYGCIDVVAAQDGPEIGRYKIAVDR